ncbi:unnamed protein product [Arabidopsis thaliana]|uniref:Zinc finger PHD-type domain-containing protein n=1 Tax=Arabidopsis thaliana TaxID=3702 RepID=A0A5S9Y7B9_ARATH|nr:unnamed protein product [Arabidopsis thaliana]
MGEIDKIRDGFLGAVKLAVHRHFLFPTNISSKCRVCSIERLEPTKVLTCNQCEFSLHEDCIEITSPSHHKHPLKLHERIIGYRRRDQCCLCRYKLLDMFYNCSRCMFEVCMACLKRPLLIYKTTSHKHPLSLMPIDSVSFTCDACGSVDNSSYPCTCLQCCFIIHRDCIDLPSVISINRHDHRISHVDILRPEEWICGVCHKIINNQYGAYSCSVCHYAVHSKCAIRDDVWDGKELDGIPEEEGDNKTEDITPFEVIDDKVIKHFSHEHILRFIYQDVLIRDENQRCYACVLPFYYDACYICTHCDFILHETCANLPRTKRHELHKNHFTLYPNPKPGEDLELSKSFFTCVACQRPSNGFRYESGNVKLDVRCATISDEFNHDSHLHSLFILSLFPRECSACDQMVYGSLSCVKLDFFLCFKCATLPKEVFNKNDKHPLYLRYSGYRYGNYWCEICEKPTDPRKWFYSCDKCCSTLHIDCVLGKSPYMRPGHSFLLSSREFQVVSNNHTSRPFCTICSLRCKDAFVLKSKDETDTSCLCSLKCLDSLVMSMQRIKL